MNKHAVYDHKGKVIEPIDVFHPGEVIAMEIEARNLKKMDVAKSLQITPGNLSELLKGKRNVTAITSLKLEKYFNIDAEFWLHLQMDYDLLQIRKEKKKVKSKSLKP
jgi:antitoxin HigA-1